MMGHSHAVSGALLFAATSPYLPPLLMHTHLRPQEILMGTVLCAGAALLPDLDHHDGTIANFLGPLSRLLCRFIAWISGGHRHATHSLLFIVLATAGTWAGITYGGRWFTLGLCFFLLAMAVRALNLCPPGHGFNAYGTVIVMAAIGTGVIAKFIPSAPGWLPYLVGVGCLAHLLGDSLTKMGVPWLWPRRTRYEIEIIKSSGNNVETDILVPIMGVATVVLLWFTALAPNTL
ncbi:metal-dependent hydrolase [Streptacidiphilus monticola]|jgi:membrane-bound metal-dependent hydrolase YbcI (DUF457 family)|uniref:Metal-dependent hydrolase n=1 Tax=Streptacidiphilus monticola TaxID=2161674 RepID=A0ABW1G4Z2_9ACTN